MSLIANSFEAASVFVDVLASCIAPLREVYALQFGQCRCCVHRDAGLSLHVSSGSVSCQALFSRASSVVFFGGVGKVDLLGWKGLLIRTSQRVFSIARGWKSFTIPLLLCCGNKGGLSEDFQHSSCDFRVV